MPANMAGANYNGLCCVFFLLILVAMLAVASLVLQIFTWNRVVGRDGGEDVDGNGLPSRRGDVRDLDAVREIRETLAKFQPDNGKGHPIQELLEYRNGDHGNKDDRVWTFGMGSWGWYSNLGFYDITTGRFGGYHVDIINAVCQAAGKNCRMVAEDASCWETDPDFGPRGGPALHRRWYDACVGFSPSHIRSLVFDFTDSLSPPPGVYFYTRPGNPGNFNWRDLRGKKIGFLKYWYTDADCVARNADKIQGSNLANGQFDYYGSSQDLLDAVLSREVDAGFFTAASTEIASQLEPVSDKITNCALDGDALMIRKDSKLLEWWNPAMQTVFNSYEYREICKDIDDYYSGYPGRSSEHVCIS